MEIKQNVIDLISLLNQLGFNIACIEGEFFVFQIFEPASSINSDTLVKGQDITRFINDNILLFQGNPLQQKDQIYSKIEQLPKIIRRYSNHFSYILFLSR